MDNRVKYFNKFDLRVSDDVHLNILNKNSHEDHGHLPSFPTMVRVLTVVSLFIALLTFCGVFKQSIDDAENGAYRQIPKNFNEWPKKIDALIFDVPGFKYTLGLIIKKVVFVHQVLPLVPILHYHVAADINQ